MKKTEVRSKLKNQKHINTRHNPSVNIENATAKKATEGITLIALVITIIVLLILAGVSIATLTGDNGLLTKANDAKIKQEEAARKEQIRLLEYEYEIAKAQGNTNLSKDAYILQEAYGVKLGDIVNYDDKINEYTGTWKVLGIEDGEILLISELLPESLTLSGREDYVNGISLLNDICDDYGKGFGAVGARSIKLDDINKITEFNPNSTLAGSPSLKGTKWEYGVIGTYENKGGAVTYSGSNGKIADVSGFTRLDGTELADAEKYEEATNFQRYDFGNGADVKYKEGAFVYSEGGSYDVVALPLESDIWSMISCPNKGNAGVDSYWLATQATMALPDACSWGLMEVATHYSRPGNTNMVCRNTRLYSSNYGEGEGTKWVRAVVKLHTAVELERNSDGILEIKFGGKTDNGNITESAVVGEKVEGSNKYYTNNGTAKIPVGYMIVPGCDDVSKGLVISDNENDTEEDPNAIVAEGNQFVWIPVTDGNKYVRNTTYANTNVSAAAIDDTDYLPEGITDEKQAVLDAGGFYIGRYEAGENLVCKKGVTAYTNIAQTAAKAEAKTFIPADNTVNVKSGLITGIQWDVAMGVISSETRTDGNGKTYDVTKSESDRHTNSPAKTGQNIADKVYNIYDLEGNFFEYVAEKNTYYEDYPFVCRGGYYSDSYAASRRDLRTGSAVVHGSFRLILYVM